MTCGIGPGAATAVATGGLPPLNRLAKNFAGQSASVPCGHFADALARPDPKSAPFAHHPQPSAAPASD